MLDTTKNLVLKTCYKMRTFIDVDSIVGLTALQAANEVKNIEKNM